MKKKISINDIAQQLGVSITTVSFILNGRAQEKRISEKLVKKVLDFVQEVNYKPSSLARSLRTGKTNIIGLMVEDISDPFFSAIARAIEAIAYQSGYKIIYCSTENATEKTRELIAMYNERHVDGYIIVPPEGVEQDIKLLLDTGKPVVLIDRYLPAIDTDFVVVDNEKSAYDATCHLIANGYKNIAFVTIDSLQPQMLDRLSGYEKAMQANGLPQLVKEIAYKSSEQAMQHIAAFIDRKKEVDAIFFATNYLCVSGLKATAGKGINIPQSIGVVSFDDYELFELYSPSITTVSQPTDKIAEHAINLLISRLKKAVSDKKFQKIILPTSLIVRKSSVR
ncbi:LacI family DNA-binding transcriptional regulator [Mucilaginibacter aquatilis]|uniref:LacI family DNA-binding transcriptional regulator n=1 Tax=Mucilaginibacter aquatilis TaxID=1517760 RepID=A0A6I4IC75_9SPHI|nr:LacI family DNA-binding transcriptional regulator [Mucilaginibacter aquatilis]MVN92831.1 LacI family DNA-binding transcriptional regulator [Mucilaginibacter aquatilis]